MSANSCQVRNVILGSMKTCRKLGVSFFAYLGDRLGLNRSAERVPLLRELDAGESVRTKLHRNLL
jgi:hypothetical protein